MKALIPLEVIEQQILLIRVHKEMLDLLHALCATCPP